MFIIPHQSQQYFNKHKELTQRLNEFDAKLLNTRPMGGLPDTVKDQVAQFNQVYGSFADLDKEVGFI
jgi:hypothetical protein